MPHLSYVCKYTYKYCLCSTWNMCYIMRMNKSTKSERKQTVTITIGPKSLAMLEAMRAGMIRLYPGLNVELTSVASAMLTQGLKEGQKTWKLTIPPNWDSNLD